jgi:2-aminoadipate transaminase
MHLPPDLLAGPQGSLFDAAVQEGVLYVPGEFFYPDEGTPAYGNTLRLSFGVQTPDKIEHGVAALARAIHRVGASGVSEIVRGTST